MGIPLVQCSRCGSTNRVPVARKGLRPICGSCREPLIPSVETAFRTPLASRFPDAHTYVTGLFLATIVTYLAGIFCPLMTISKQFTLGDLPLAGGLIKFFGAGGMQIWGEAHTTSLVEGLADLLSAEPLIFVIIFAFSIAFPLSKLGACLFLWYIGVPAHSQPRWVHILALISKWSMVDVMVVSLLVVILKLGDLVKVEVHIGFYAFAVSVVSSMLLTTTISKRFNLVPHFP